MKTRHDPRRPPPDADPYFVRRALAENKHLVKITWDEADGYPEHAWGYVQWSVRPYVQWYGCDGTTDGNVHFVAKALCERLGLDYAGLYERAYCRPQDEPPGRSWVRFFDWSEAGAETIVPELSETALCGVLHDLEEINNHSLVSVLEEEFAALGYDVERYWERRPEGALVAPRYEQLAFFKEHES